MTLIGYLFDSCAAIFAVGSPLRLRASLRTVETLVVMLLCLPAIHDALAYQLPVEVSQRPRANASYTRSEFDQLLKLKLSELPDLRQYYDNAEKTWIRQALHYGTAQKVHLFLNGSSARDFVSWFAAQLRLHSREEVEQMRVPPLAEIRKNAMSDFDVSTDYISADQFGWWHFQVGRDIGVSLMAVDQVNAYGTLGDWDVTSQEMFLANLANKGTPFDRFRISPGIIEDPLGGLEDFYNDTLTFVPADKAGLQKTNHFFSKMADEDGGFPDYPELCNVFRFLRLHKEYPELKVSSDTWSTLERIATKISSEGIYPRNFWLAINFKKLRRAYEKDTTGLVKALDRIGLIPFLAFNGYRLPAADITDADRAELINFVSERQPEGLLIMIDNPPWASLNPTSLREVLDLKKFSDQNSPELIESAFKFVKTASEFLQLIAPPKESYRSLEERGFKAPYVAVDEHVIEKHLSDFLRMEPTFDELITLRDSVIQHTSIQVAKTFRTTTKPLWVQVNELATLKALQENHGVLNRQQQLKLAGLYKQPEESPDETNKRIILTLRQTNDFAPLVRDQIDLRNFVSLVGDKVLLRNAIEQAVKHAASPKEFVDVAKVIAALKKSLTDRQENNPYDQFSHNAQWFWQTQSERFFALSPSAKEGHDLREVLSLKSTRYGLARVAYVLSAFKGATCRATFAGLKN